MSLSSMDYWRLADELSIVDAAILITGNDPSEKVNDAHNFDEGPNWVQRTDYEGFDAVFKALKNAVLSNKLPVSASFQLTDQKSPDYYSHSFYAVLREGTKLFKQRNLDFWKHDSLVFLETEPNWEKTLVSVENLKAWLQSRHVFPDFFFPKGDPNSIMNKNSPRYSAKLACAVAAWQSVTRPGRNKTPKQSIEAWVQANGTRFGLANDDGLVPANALSEISKVANWQPQGGAAKSGVGFDEPEHEENDAPTDHFEELEHVEKEDGYGRVIFDIPF